MNYPQQSPIDIDSSTIRTSEVWHPSCSYPDARWQERDSPFNAGMVPVPAGSGGHLRIGDGSEPLAVVEFHTHAPSEHLWDGVQGAGELHIVHVDGDRTSVLALRLAIGRRNAAVDRLLERQGALSALMPPGRTACTYLGSRTTPPFGQEVRWFVVDEAVEVTDAQLRALVGEHAENARRVFDLGDRVVDAAALEVDGGP